MALRNVQKVDQRNLFPCTPSTTAEKRAHVFSVMRQNIKTKHLKKHLVKSWWCAKKLSSEGIVEKDPLFRCPFDHKF